jgi:hypothetical protein
MTRVRETARGRGVERIASLTVRVFDVNDAFRLLPGFVGVIGATKRVELRAVYETTAGGSLDLSFRGRPDDATPVREFLEPLVRAARDRLVQAAFFRSFEDGFAVA